MQRSLHFLLAFILAVTLGLGAHGMALSPCPDMQEKAMPCHGDGSAPSEQAAEDCCQEAFCPKCFSPMPLPDAAPAGNAEHSESAGFAYIPSPVSAHTVQTLERPPKYVG